MPRPNPGESQSDYIGRFMASGEARRDYPDEKQRAAVAYSMFRERKNNMQVCPSCGCEMAMNPDAVITDCASCGNRLLGKQTPPVESLDNLCRECPHPINPEHDDFGCHVEGCACAVTAAQAIESIQAVLPNAVDKGPKAPKPFAGLPENSNAGGGGPYDQPNPMGCNGCDDSRAPLNKHGYCKRCDAEPRANSGEAGTCYACNHAHEGPCPGEGGKPCSLKCQAFVKRDSDGEKKNSWTPEFLKRNPDYKSRIEPKLAAKWDRASIEQRTKWLAETGSHQDDAGLSFSEMTSGSHGGSQAEIMMELMTKLCGERINAANKPYYCGNCDFSSRDFASAHEHIKATGHALAAQPRENAASREAFEGHTKECTGCANALESGKPEAMCETGKKLMQAENTNSAPPTPDEAKKALAWISKEPLGAAVHSFNWQDGKTYTVAQLEAIARGEKQNAGDINDLDPQMAALWDQSSDAEKRRCIAMAGLGIGIIQFRWSQMPDGAKAALKSKVFEVENTNSMPPLAHEREAAGRAAYGSRA